MKKSNHRKICFQGKTQNLQQDGVRGWILTSLWDMGNVRKEMIKKECCIFNIVKH